ncbi:MAG: cytochrome P460 family protein [Pseudomonadota bacterium]
MRKRRIHAMAVAVAVAAALDASAFAQGFAQDFAPGVSANGAISVPNVDYRRDWSHLGTFSVPREDHVEFHSVYAEPKVVDAYRETGEYPDGAVLIKELWAGKTEELTTGSASHASTPAGWFVMIKDREGRFAGNPLWGDGWGWALFNADDPENTVTTNYQDDCIACHEPVRAADFVHSYAYPALAGKSR